MDLAEANTLLKTEMQQHQLIERGWIGKFDNAKRRFGVCRYGSKHKEISISQPLTILNPESEVRDTILHEIAHALAWEEFGENCGHDERWKAICRRIGARPERCYDDEEVISPDAPWVVCHRETGEIFSSYQRRPKRDFSEVWIRGRKTETLGKLEVRLNPKIYPEGAIEQFDPFILDQFRDEIMTAVQAVSDKYGVNAQALKGSYNTLEYNLSLGFSIKPEDGVDPLEKEFALLAPIFGLSAEDYQREFRGAGGKIYRLIAFKPRNRKYPVIGVNSQGKRFKFTLGVLDEFV